jgi:hypothetical protein
LQAKIAMPDLKSLVRASPWNKHRLQRNTDIIAQAVFEAGRRRDGQHIQDVPGTAHFYDCDIVPAEEGNKPKGLVQEEEEDAAEDAEEERLKIAAETAEAKRVEAEKEQLFNVANRRSLATLPATKASLNRADPILSRSPGQ